MCEFKGKIVICGPQNLKHPEIDSRSVEIVVIINPDEKFSPPLWMLN